MHGRTTLFQIPLRQHSGRPPALWDMWQTHSFRCKTKWCTCPLGPGVEHIASPLNICRGIPVITCVSGSPSMRPAPPSTQLDPCSRGTCKSAALLFLPTRTAKCQNNHSPANGSCNGGPDPGIPNASGNRCHLMHFAQYMLQGCNV